LLEKLSTKQLPFKANKNRRKFVKMHIQLRFGLRKSDEALKIPSLPEVKELPVSVM
jgi:hypothetical protein